MHTSIVFLVMSVVTANVPQTPQWLTDYPQAQKAAGEAKKPLAVFIGSGQAGWDRVVREGTIDPKVNKLLAAQYVCLYVDTDTAKGRALAGAFEVAGRGLVISDRKVTTQAYSLSGDLSRAELTQTLEKYADAGREVRTTETVIRQVEPVYSRTVSVPTTSYPVYSPGSRYVPQYQLPTSYSRGGG